MSTQATGARAPVPYSELQQEHEHLHGAFGGDRFGVVSEKLARFFGTPQ